MLYLTRRERFCAAHRLFVAGWSDEKNMEIFGNCSNKNWHGHNYILYVTVKGEPDPVTGMIINATELKKIIRSEVIDHLDHKNLNLDVEFMQGKMPTAENLVKIIWQRLAPYAKGFALHRVRIYETENIYADYYGE